VSDNELTPEQTVGLLRMMGHRVIRDGRRIVVITLLVLLDIALTFGVAWDAVRLHSLSTQDQYQSCVSGNQFRAADTLLWEHVLIVTTPPHPTTQQKETVAEFRQYLGTVMAPRNCGAK
jgi:hypothetical protein